MKRTAIAIALFISIIQVAQAQMFVGTDTLYGNEWIDYDKAHIKYTLKEQGIYRINFSSIQDQFPPDIKGKELKLFNYGTPVSFYVSTTEELSSSDYILFVGQANDGRLDSHLYLDPKDQINPNYSFYSDYNSYFLSYGEEDESFLMEEIENESSNTSNGQDHIHSSLISNITDRYFKKTYNYGRLSLFDNSEAYGTNFYSTHNLEFNDIKKAENEENTELILHYFSHTDTAHHFQLFINDELSNERIDSGIGVFKDSLSISNTYLSENNNIVLQGLNLNAAGNSVDKVSISYIELNYPRSLDLSLTEQLAFSVPNEANPYLEFTNADEETYYIIDKNNKYIVSSTSITGNLKFKLENQNENSSLLLSKASTITVLSDFNTVNFTDYSAQSFEMLMVYNEVLKLEANGNNIIEEYANYHEIESPVSKSVETIEIQEIIDQFAYGIGFHPIGIRNIGHYFDKNNADFEYLYLIGKARLHYKIRDENDFNQAIGQNYLIPTIGNFSSDNLLASSSNEYRLDFSVGRLSARNASDVRSYLNKVREYESSFEQVQSIENKLWTKKILHLVGGSEGPEEISIFNYLKNAESIIENNSFGGEVITYRKFYNDQISTESGNTIKEIIDDGLAILNVFGHSNPLATQYPITNAANYNNKGKYPFFISGGCYSGQCSNEFSGIGENLILTPDKAGILYLATTGYGYISSIGTFYDKLYRNFGEDNYGESIGMIIRKSFNELLDINFVGSKTLAQQMILQGDPSLRFYYHEKADYTLGDDWTILEDELSTDLDSFEIQIPILNIGKNIGSQNLKVDLYYQFPDGDIDFIHTDSIISPTNISYTGFKLKVPDIDRLFGELRILVHLDPLNELEEQDNGGELNNEYRHFDDNMGYPISFKSNIIKPVAPFNFQLKNNEDFELSASTNIYDENGKTFLLEIDSSLLFNSPSKITLSKQDVGGLLKWSLPEQLETNQVYYWRTAVENPDNDNVWKQSSFIIEEGNSEGWNQSHNDQYQQDTFVNLSISDSEDRIVFNTNPVNFAIKNIVKGSGNSVPRVTSDNGSYFEQFTANSFNGVCMVVIEPENLNCVSGLGSNGQEIIYAFPWGIGEGHMFKVDNQNERQEVISFINEVVPMGSYVFFLTIQSGFNDIGYLPDEWAADSLVTGGINLFNVLESHGAEQIRQLEVQGSKPYGLIFQKGNTDFNVQEGINAVSNDFGNVSTSLTGNFDTGYMRSTYIGSSTQWNELKYSISEIEDHDSIRVDLYGIKTGGQRDLLSSFSNPVGNIDLTDLVSASTYPQIFLEYFVQDKIQKTVPSLDYWKVLFDPYPELAVEPNTLLVLNDTVNQGEIMDFQLSSQNIGTIDMDSVLVRISLQNERGFNSVSYKKYPPLEKGNSFTISESIETNELQGMYTLTAFINPDNDQNEQFLFNNIFSRDLLVIADNINPLLAVKFDGQRILNGDIVSTNPTISIELKDENPYLILNDTSLFEIRLKFPDNNIQTVYFNTPGLLFTPASTEDNTAQIEFENIFDQDGIHTLFVEARDVAGNAISNLSESPDGLAEGLNYKIDFEIIHKSSLSNFYNYPNPFTNSTRFVYTLTGDRIPASFKIQIMTSSGKVVREISQAEIGPLRVGTHQTEYAWDGRDQFGDKLANGVYLYKVIAKDENGDNFEKYDLNDNEAIHFLNGYGKMVIIN